VTAVIDRARRLATVKTPDREIILRDVPVGESPYSLLQQANAALAQNCQPFVAWRLEWVNSEVDRLWPDGIRAAFAAPNGRPDPAKVLQFSALVQ
jgi:hypothetical protein